MSQRRRICRIVAMLLLLGAVFAAALYAQTPADTSGNPAQQPPLPESVEQPAETPAPDVPTHEVSQPGATVARSAEPSQTDAPATELSASGGSTETTDAPDASANEPIGDEETRPASEEMERQVAAAIPHVEWPKVDPDAERQWGLDSIDAYGAWEFPPLKNATATAGVGILDNGFNNFHEDLIDNVRSTYNATTDENAPVYCPPDTPSPNHGSHVAGIVAAT